ncbi:hypothetical protein [Stenotrophomonas bentonitica]|uniref:hypothetical protein n=1 Tax=Stenotrophomonas bentonitica TaxID=1450134 RepID=UPI00345E5A2D
MIGRSSKKTSSTPRLRVSPNAEALLRHIVASASPARLRQLASDPAGRVELLRLQRIATARVEEFEGYLQLAKDAESLFSTALKSKLEV